MNESIWILSQHNEKTKALSEGLGIAPELAQVLINRKITDVEEANRFLYGDINDLHNPFLMKGMDIAVEKIFSTIDSGKKILIFGDYDVDGILSVVILSRALESFGAEVDYFIPDRLTEGYGLKESHLEVVKSKNASLIISVDCGVKAVPFVQKAKKEGIDVIITDHHQPGPCLPDAIAVLNPVLPSIGYPDTKLAGIGVVFKLIQAILDKTGKSSVLPHYLKLVAIGTIADVAKLRGENRIFVKTGLNALSDVSNIGLKKLLSICGLNNKKITVGDVGFRIGPRINAAGRLGKTDLAVRLFFSDSEQECSDLVSQLDNLNTKRQRVEEKIFLQALDRIKKESLDRKYKLLILGCEDWHRGVIGIVASKLKEYFYRPVILFAYKDGKAYGSGRSISDFALIDCLEQNRDVFLNYGGHPIAVGCELELEKMGLLKELINSFVSSKISDEQLKRKIKIDAKISFNDINSSFLEQFSFLSPFGVGNPKPVFLTEDVVVVTEPRKLKGKHCKLLLRENGKTFEGLGWGKDFWADSISKGDKIRVAYSLYFSEYMGDERLSLVLEDIKT
jgi:single-stranded-DNA-specific exonuclease